MSYGTGLTFISLLEKMMSSLASLEVVQYFLTFSKISTGAYLFSFLVSKQKKMLSHCHRDT